MNDTIKQVAETIATKAEAIRASGKGYQAIVQEVIVMGGRAMMTKNMTLEQAEYIASSMVAAIAIAKDSTKNQPPAS